MKNSISKWVFCIVLGFKMFVIYQIHQNEMFISKVETTHILAHEKIFISKCWGLEQCWDMAPKILHLIVTFSFEHKTYINDFVEHCVALVD
jgi:hypothetical protein